MMTVRTLLKVGDDFIPVENFAGPVADENYIEGAIELTINGKELLSRLHWDLVDQLWCYLAPGVEQASRGELFSTYFPDSPIQVIFQPDVARREITVEVKYKTGPADLRATVGLEEFRTVMSQEARRSLGELGRVAPGKQKAYAHALRELGAP